MWVFRKKIVRLLKLLTGVTWPAFRRGRYLVCQFCQILLTFTLFLFLFFFPFRFVVLYFISVSDIIYMYETKRATADTNSQLSSLILLLIRWSATVGVKYSPAPCRTVLWRPNSFAHCQFSPLGDVVFHFFGRRSYSLPSTSTKAHLLQAYTRTRSRPTESLNVTANVRI